MAFSSSSSISSSKFRTTELLAIDVGKLKGFKLFRLILPERKERQLGLFLKTRWFFPYYHQYPEIRWSYCWEISLATDPADFADPRPNTDIEYTAITFHLKKIRILWYKRNLHGNFVFSPWSLGNFSMRLFPIFVAKLISPLNFSCNFDRFGVVGLA